MSGNRHQWATVWKPTALDAYGNPSWASPTQIKVRWEHADRRFITENGHEQRGQNAIYFERKGLIEQQDYIAEGKHTATSPINGAWEVKRIRITPNLSGTKIECMALA